MDSLPDPLSQAPQAGPKPPRGIAPAWHTGVLIAGIVGVSLIGMLRPEHLHNSANRLLAYATTAAMELLMLGWVVLGLRLRNIRLGSLLGVTRGDFRAVAHDFWVAIWFWAGSMVILAGLGVTWTRVEAEVTHQPLAARRGTLDELTPSERRATRTMEEIAPANGEETACWVLLCGIAGFVEEVVFRGYLQTQFTAWAHGAATAGVVFSAILFGAAHGYQGVRNMTMLAVFGLLFSLLALERRGLRACIFAHAWHDLLAGLELGVLRSRHVI